MTAVGKKDLSENITLTKKQEEEYRRLEKLINKELNKRYPGEKKVRIGLGQHLPDAQIQEKIKRQFGGQKGWKVNFQQGHYIYDGASVEMS